MMRLSMKRPILATLSTISLLLLTGCVDSKTVAYDSLDNANLSAFTSDYDLHRQIDKTKLCSKAKKKLVPATNYNALLRKVNKLSEVSSSEARRASRFISQSNWATSIDESIYESRGTSYSQYISDSLYKWLLGKVSDYADSEGRTLRVEDVETAAYSISYEAIDPTVRYCKLKTKYSDGYGELAARYNSLLDDVEYLADQVPWYPEGYNQWAEDPTLAWQWSSGSCYLGDSCWHIKVVSQTGCSSLYGEINIFDSYDNVIDYTNDLVGSLGSYQTAVMEFSTYNDFADTGRLTKLNCY